MEIFLIDECMNDSLTVDRNVKILEGSWRQPDVNCNKSKKIKILVKFCSFIPLISQSQCEWNI